MTGALRRRLVLATAIAVVVTMALLPGSGIGSSVPAVHGAQVPAALAAAIHARFGAGAIRSGSIAAPEDGPMLGYSVSLSADGTTALVGAPGDWDTTGSAYVFRVSGAGSWATTATPAATLLDKPHPDDGELFGWNVALSADGTTAFVGAPSAVGGYGAVFVFHASAEDAWASSSAPTATLTLDSDALGVGLAVSSDGTTVVAGAPFSNDLAGVAYVFHASSEDAWASSSTPAATLSNADEDPDDGNVGWSVAISGDGTTALLSDYGSPDGGGAYVYHAAAEDSWTSRTSPTAILSDADSGPADGLGSSVALSADGTVAVLADPGFTAPSADDYTGGVEVFHASGEAAWSTTTTPTAVLTVAGGTEDDLFGAEANVSADGKTVLVAAPGLDYPHGGAYIFHASGEDAWATSSAPTAVLDNHGGHTGGVLTPTYAQPALSADGATAIDGVVDAEFQTGEADIFHVADASSWASSSTPNAVLTVSALHWCAVPKLIGRTVAAAKSALKAAYCQIGKVTKAKHAKAKKGRVFSQSRKAGSRLAHGAKVSVKVAK